MFKRLIFALLLGVTFIGGAAAQDATATPTLVLVPFADNNYGITGVVPSSWTQYSPGLWLREEPPQTLIAQQGLVGDFNEVVGALLDQLGLAGLPEPVGSVSANGLDWALYATGGPEGSNILVDWAVTAKDASVYIVLLQADAAERDALRETVFLPAVNALTPIESAPVVPEDADYTAENVTFYNGVIPFEGTLTLPAGNGPHPAVLLLTGSGAQDRDESLEGIGLKPFAVIADALTRAGIAVLRYDDRGYGRSGGDYQAATTADFAADAQAALAYLRSRPEIDSAQIGALGHSEGANVAAHLVSAGAPVAFYVLMGGPGVNGADLLTVQNRRLYAAEGLADDKAGEQIAFISEMFPLVLNGDTLRMGELLDRRIREQTADFTDEQLAQIGNLETLIGQTVQAQLADFSRSWWPYFLRYDPAAAWATVNVPVLAVYGALDVQVDAEQNSAALRAALEQAPESDFEIVTLPDANHLFQHAVSGAVSEYQALQPHFTDDFLPTVTDWILAHVTLP